MYSRRLVLRHRIPDRHESTLRIMVHAEERTDRFGRSISEKFRVPFVRESYKWPYFDKDRSNVICNASSVLASRDIGLEKRGKKNLKRIRFRYKKKRCWKLILSQDSVHVVDEVELRTNTFVSQLTVTVHGTYGRLDHGENPFFTEIALGYGAHFTWLWQRTGERQNRLTTNVPFSLSGIENHRVQNGALGSFFFFPLNPATPDRIIWSLLSSPKEQNASGPIRPPSPSWYMIYALLSLSSADRGYLLIVGPEREKSSTPRDHGYHLAEIVPCPSCHVGVASWWQI